MKKVFLNCMLLLCALIVGSGNLWAQVSSAAPTNGGSYVVAVYGSSKYQALPNTTGDRITMSGSEITLNALNKVNTSVAAGKTWTLEEGTGDNAGKYYLKYTDGSSNTYYLYKNGTGKSNYNFAINKTSKNYWSFTTNGTGYTVAAVDRGSNNLNIQYNSGSFRCHSSSTPIILLQIGDAPTLDHITLSGTYKTTFYVDDEFTYEGLIVTAVGTDDSENIVSPTSVSSPDMSTTGTKTVTVSYTQGAVTKTATYDITVSARPQFTVSFSDGGSLTEESVGSGVTLPSRSNDGDYTFVGWAEANIAAGSTSATTTAAGATYHPADNCTLYPVYSYSMSAYVEEWIEVTGVPEDGTYVICDGTAAMKAVISSSRFTNGSVSISAGTPRKLSSSPASDCVWSIYKASDNYYRIKYGSYYAGGTNSKNQGALIESVSADLAKWTITYDEGYAFENYGRSQAASDSGNKWLRHNGGSGWATYASSTGGAPCLFKKTYTSKVTTYYTTSKPVSTYSRSVTSGNWGTICLAYEVYAYSGATFYSIAGKRVDGSGNPTSIVLEEVGGSLVAGRPYIFQASASSLVAAETGDAVAAGNNNGLVGSLTGTDVDEGMYLLSSGQIVKAGTGCSIGANKAYINMSNVPVYGASSAPGRRFVDIPMAPTTPTNIDAVEESNEAVKFFQNGKLFIKKNGIVYDVLGHAIH